jgi:hypothetical protein
MLKPTHVIFACDESGAKGYADQDESFPGEVGVFAGILMPQECAAQTIPFFRAVAQKYAGHSGKLHIADLDPATKESLRADVYEAIRKSQLPCFWYGIHVAGLHRWHLEGEGLRFSAREARRSRVKLGSPRANPVSLHVELFSGLYSRLIAFCEERGRQELHVEVRLDTVDNPIAKDFENAAKSLLGLDPKVKAYTGFDPVTNAVVKGELRSEISLPEELSINVTVRSLRLNRDTDPDGLVLAADVLANSLAHLFHTRRENELYRALNNPESVACHPLASQLDSFWNWGGGDLVGDALYAHPKNPDLFPEQAKPDSLWIKLKDMIKGICASIKSLARALRT